jgi:hypothetical protein
MNRLWVKLFVVAFTITLPFSTIAFKSIFNVSIIEGLLMAVLLAPVSVFISTLGVFFWIDAGFSLERASLSDKRWFWGQPKDSNYSVVHGFFIGKCDSRIWNDWTQRRSVIYYKEVSDICDCVGDEMVTSVSRRDMYDFTRSGSDRAWLHRFEDAMFRCQNRR